MGIQINKISASPILRTFAVLLLCLVLLSPAAIYAEKVELTGDASWYYGFMISGNRFFRNGHYAAMWDVPLGAKAKVTNLANGKSIIVTINDRGPNKQLVAKGRIIDLAAKAFYDLNGNFKPSTIRVKVEILQ